MNNPASAIRDECIRAYARCKHYTDRGRYSESTSGALRTTERSAEIETRFGPSGIRFTYAWLLRRGHEWRISLEQLPDGRVRLERPPFKIPRSVKLPAALAAASASPTSYVDDPIVAFRRVGRVTGGCARRIPELLLQPMSGDLWLSRRVRMVGREQVLGCDCRILELDGEPDVVPEAPAGLRMERTVEGPMRVWISSDDALIRRVSGERRIENAAAMMEAYLAKRGHELSPSLREYHESYIENARGGLRCRWTHDLREVEWAAD